MAENLSQRGYEVAHRLSAAVGEAQASAEVNSGIERIFSYASWADKFDGAVHNPPFRNIAIAMNEPIGAVGIICPHEVPLLGFLSLVLPVVAAGNTVVAVPSRSEEHTSELQSPCNLVCRLLLEKKKTNTYA